MPCPACLLSSLSCSGTNNILLKHTWRPTLLNFMGAPCSQKTKMAKKYPHSLFTWTQLAANDHPALSYSYIRPMSIFAHDSLKTCGWLSCLPTSVKSEDHILFFEMFLIDKYFPYHNSLDNIISLIIQWILLSTIWARLQRHLHFKESWKVWMEQFHRFVYFIKYKFYLKR